MFSREFGLYMRMFGDHLSRKQVDRVSEVAVFRIVDPENTTHTHVFKITQTEISHPHVLSHQFGERNTVESEHVFHCFHSNILLELAVFVEVGIRVLLRILHFFINFTVSIVVTFILAVVSALFGALSFACRCATGSLASRCFAVTCSHRKQEGSHSGRFHKILFHFFSCLFS